MATVPQTTILHSDSSDNWWLHIGLLIINLCQRVTNLICYVELARRICTEDKYLNFTLNREEKEKREDEHTTRSIRPGPVMVVTDTLQWRVVVTGSVFRTGFIQTAVDAFNSNFQSCLTPKPHYTLSLRCNKTLCLFENEKDKTTTGADEDRDVQLGISLTVVNKWAANKAKLKGLVFWPEYDVESTVH